MTKQKKLLGSVYREWAIVIIEGILVLITFATLIYTIYYSQSTLLEMQRENRPYVQPSSEEIEMVRDSETGILGLGFKLINFGNSPAKIIFIDNHMYIKDKEIAKTPTPNLLEKDYIYIPPSDISKPAQSSVGGIIKFDPKYIESLNQEKNTRIDSTIVYTMPGSKIEYTTKSTLEIDDLIIYNNSGSQGASFKAHVLINSF